MSMETRPMKSMTPKSPTNNTLGDDRYDILPSPGSSQSWYLTGMMGSTDAEGALQICRRTCVNLAAAAQNVTLANDDATGEPGTGDFLISFWMWTEDVSLVAFASKYKAADDDGWIFATTAAGLVEASVDDTGGTPLVLTSVTAVNDGEWHHVALYGDRGEEDGLKLYIDGVQEDVCLGTGAEKFKTDYASAITGGDSGLVFKGTNSKVIKLSAFGIFKGTITAANLLLYVAACFNADPANILAGIGKKFVGTETALATAYNFDEDEGSVAHDIVSTKDATLTGATWVAGGAPLDLTDPDDEMGGLGPIYISNYFDDTENKAMGSQPLVVTFPHAIKIGRNNPLTVTATAALVVQFFVFQDHYKAM